MIAARWHRRALPATLALLMLALAACGSDTSNTSSGTGGGSGALGDVIARSDPASTADCPDGGGGTVVSSGIDANHNGVLDPDEITARSTICSSASALPVLVRLRDELPGSHCAAGGTAVESGPDRNGNGMLDDDEVQHTDYACGDPLLLRTAVEPPGAHCAAGGVALLAGRDRDHDGALSDLEVESTQYVCGGVFVGDVAINSADDAVPLAGVVAITGALSINPTVTAASLPQLIHVGGALTISPIAMAPISLPALVDVGGALVLGNAATLAVPKLARVGALTMNQSHVLDLTAFTALNQIDGALDLENSDIMEIHLNLATLGSVTFFDNRTLHRVSINTTNHLGDISIEGCSGMSSFDAVVTPTLGTPSTLGGEIFITDMFSIGHVGLTADHIGDAAFISTPSLTDLEITTPHMDRLSVNDGAPLEVTWTSPASTLELGSLSESMALAHFQSNVPLELDGSLEITNNFELQTLDLPQLDHVGGAVTIIGNSELDHLDLTGLQSVGSIAVTNNPELPTCEVLALFARITGTQSQSGNDDSATCAP